MNLILPSVMGFFYNKKVKIYFLFFSINIIVFSLLIYICLLIDSHYSYKIENNVSNRTLAVSSEEEIDLDKILDIEHVKNAYYRFVTFGVDGNDGINLTINYKSVEELPTLKYGEQLSENDDCEKIILPEKIIGKERTIINLEELAGEKIKLSAGEIEFEALVSGVFENKNLSNMFYINSKLYNKLIEINNNVCNKRNAFLIVDEYKNVDTIMNMLENLGYNSNIYDTTGKNDINIYQITVLIIKVLIGIALVSNLIIISIIIDSMLQDERQYIAILKAIGYRVKDIVKIIRNRTLLLIGISIIISYIISMGVSGIIVNLLNNVLSENIILNIKILLMIFAIFIIVLFFITYILIFIKRAKIKNISAIELLKE
ncbi:MAG: hypothetical protein J6A15_09370 [Clostridia bacterium]|nr:hypothetical protein [Clostridia bacterium]